MTNLASDASQMLAAALEQMDDIIAGSRIQGMDYDNGPVVTNNQVNITHPKENGSHADVPRLITELRSAAERSIENGEENLLHDRVEDSTRQYIVRLLGDKKELATSPGSHEKMKRLEGDKDSLQLQVNVLTDQLEAQNEKIEELEYACAKKSKQLADSETKLLQESEIHCELEQSQQNYAIEASKLKARLDSVENETLVVRERAIMAESKIEEQQHEMNKLMSKYQQSQKIVGELQTECHKWQEKYMETQVKLVRSQTETAELKARLRYSHALLDDLQAKKVKTLDKEVEKEKLKIAVDSLIAGNKEKDKTIEDLNQRLSKFYHVQEMAAINGRVEIDMLLDIENQRTDSFSTSSSATGETDTSKDSHQVPQGSSPVSPDRDYTMMVDRTEEMFGSKTSRRSASLENLQTNVLPSTNELSSDLSHPSPDPQTDLPVTGGPRTIHVPIHIQGGTVQPLHSTPQAPNQDSSTFLTEDPRTIHVPIHVERLSPGLADPSSLPGDMEHLTTGLPEVVTSASSKTPPFPTNSDPSWEAVPKKVNFDLDATTEISNDQRSSVGEDFEERPGIDHVSVFLTQGANCSPSNTNGYLGNGVRPDSLDSPTDLTFIDIDDANMAHFRRDVSPISGHLTLPAPKKTTDSEGDLAARSSPSGYRTLPSPRRNQEFDLPNKQQQSAHGGTPEPRKPRASFGKGLFKITSKKTSSAPNLAMTESEGEDALGVQRPRNVTFQSLERGGFPAPPGTPPMEYRKRKGIKKLIGKLKRSGSVNLHNGDEDEEAPVEFSRNGRFRATAGPRLAWSRDLKKNENGNGTSELNAPFAKWDSEQVADWLRGMGLAQYAAACRVWVKNGGTLLGAAPLELEKYLGLKNPLHRKKLQLALQAMGSECEDKQGDLDYHWVTRWLDDVGLPQYKDTFLEAKVDGRMLHYMTVDDLLLLKVTSAFHHVSIMRGIQCLRLHNFHPSCLRRRPTDEPYETGTQVALWTNHRVMEWLRSVDLSEYAPNLRGSGVHGGLMVLEPRFTAETLASILCIPGNKTLLRRHLSTHFISLIGPDIQQQKREAEKQPLFVPLNFLAKVKPKKRTFGKSRRGTEMEDYICPMDLGHPSNLNGLSHMNGNRPAPPSYKVEVRSAGKVHKQMDEDQADGPEMKEGTAQKFGALSQEIDSLTTMLSDSDMDRSTHV
ncbi:liprin-beta-1 isoform X2 [Strongylocentrotus purpuratus]|uniref:SAM domain-containing protein n=1 Tax=Strongylocentrotus purpuratus TaxID=7668 RepID=A0A7M7P3J7_STRPU|nr:liprin-beta-1 isoform X2 [Strongylocentrotus purpuratus]